MDCDPNRMFQVVRQPFGFPNIRSNHRSHSVTSLPPDSTIPANELCQERHEHIRLTARLRSCIITVECILTLICDLFALRLVGHIQTRMKTILME